MKYQIEIPDPPASSRPDYEQTSRGRAEMEIDETTLKLCHLEAAKEVLRQTESELRDRHALLTKIVQADPKSQGGTAQAR